MHLSMKQKNSPKPKKKISLMFDDYPIIGIYIFYNRWQEIKA
jgi:hypothetical protein